MPEDIEPIIIGPGDTPDTTKQPRGQFILHDDMFEEVPPNSYPLETYEFGPLRNPHFPMGDVLKWVLGNKSQTWLKNLLRDTGGEMEGISFKRLKKGRRGSIDAPGERRLTLPDIERFLWALFDRGAINGIQLQNAMEIVVAVARQWGAEFTIDHPKKDH